jgi:glycosyltransferase involved in cell wall biosynthesis
MNTLKENLHLLSSLTELVKTKNEEYYKYTSINYKEVNNDTISIVMTTHERSKQLYFTLETINRCSYKNVHVIIVDDSANDPLLEDKLREFNIHIDFISINRDKKFWANPCINYNIGFQYVKGGKVIIQNGEVCYVGDILKYVNDNIINDMYYVFDVIATRDFDCNEKVYAKDNLDIHILKKNIFQFWYQHTIYRNKKYHFLTSLTKDTFDKIKEFSYDYSFGSCYDDDDLLLKIINQKIRFLNVKVEEHHIGGIHLFHGYTKNISNNAAYTRQQNRDLYNKKRNYFSKTGKYLEISDYDNLEEKQQQFNILSLY